MPKFISFCYFSALIVLFCQNSYSQKLVTIKGQVLDSLTQKPLSYASLGIAGCSIGTISNEKGYFEFVVPDSLIHTKLVISYLGYRTYESTVVRMREKKSPVLLQPVTMSIQEVHVRPVTPEDIVRQAIRNISKNYPEHSFISTGFYRELLKENDHFIQFVEAFVSTYNPAYSDTTAIQARIIQGRTRGDLKPMQFMYDEMHRKYEKKQRKAARKGIKSDSTGPATITVVFGGPGRVLENDPVKSKEFALDTNMMKNFRYRFERDNELDDHQLYTIAVESKRVIDHMKIRGKIYIDKKTLAIVNTNLDMKIIIPVYFKPVLFTMGLSFKNVHLSTEDQYREINSKWFLQKIIVNGEGDATKRRIFKSDYRSHFVLQQAFVSTSVKSDHVKPFTPAECLKINRPISQQLGKFDPGFWETHNKIDFGKPVN